MSQYEHIDSGLLEQYALGLCTPDEEASVEKLLQESAEARETFDEIQRTLENMAALRAISPPEEMKARIFSEIRDISAAPSGKVGPMKPRSNLLKVAAIVGLLIAIGSIFRLQQLRQETISENERLQNEASELKSNLAELNSELNTVQESCSSWERPIPKN